MFHAVTRFSVRLVERYLPDPYVFVILLTLVAGAAAVGVESRTPMQIVRLWGGGFWGLLPFTMQMVLVLVTGFMLAKTPPVTKLLERIARLARTPGSAIILVTLVGLAANWINWGFGLVVGAVFAKEVARSVRVDYRLLVASAYSGFLVWHAGLSGSIPLTVATEGHFTADLIGIIPPSQTIFSALNLTIVAVLFVVVPLVNRLMMPPPEESIYVDPQLLDEGKVASVAPDTPAGRLEHGRLLTGLIGLAGLAYMFHYFVVERGGINLNIVNFSFLFLAIVLHGTPRRLLDSLEGAIKGTGGIVLQFPFYAGIMAIMNESGLAATLSEWFVSLASAQTLPFWALMSAGLVNLFIPSGGGQWAIQAPVVLEAAKVLGADIPRVAMAVAWGDAWTSMLQPFWALPVLAIAGLKAKDIMGFCLIHLFVAGTVITLGLTFL